jgi:hypothetical protein
MSYQSHHNLGTKSTYTTIFVDNVVESTSKIRIVHNVANGPNVDGFLDGKMVLKSVAYKAISDYLEIKSGYHTISVYVSGTNTIIGKWNVNLDPGSAYTLIVHGLIKDLKSIAPLLLMDNLTCPMSGKAHVRFIHAAASIPSVDIYAGDNMIFNNVSYGKTGNPVYLAVNSGTVDVSVTTTGSTNIALGPISLQLSSGGIYTIIASGLLGDNMSPLSALVSEDSKGSCVMMYNYM